MAKITTFNRQNLPALRAALDAALVGVGQKYGLEIKTGSCTFNSENVTWKLHAAVVTADGTVRSKAATDFERYHNEHNIPVEALGQEFISKGKTLVLTGYNPRSRKFPFLAHVAGNPQQRFSVSPHAVERAFLGKKPIVPTKPQKAAGFSRGDAVTATWSDGESYPATFLKTLNSGLHRVRFEDGSVFAASSVELA